MQAGFRIGTTLMAICIATPLLAFEGNSTPATRSGTTLPEPRTIAAKFQIGGIYVPKTSQFTSHRTGMLEGSLTWNFRIYKILGLFGRHSLAGMWWGDISVLTMGHEVGARILFGPHLAFEAAYLGHRAEYEWLDGEPWSLGGVNDHGAEIGVWGHVNPYDNFRIEGHLLFRRFDTPTSGNSVSFTDQIVFGFGIRALIQLAPHHTFSLELEELRVYRPAHRRLGVEESTWNTIGTISWRFSFAEKMGAELGLTISTNWYAGVIPMLEIKRSMIGEPMARGFAAFYFSI